MATYYVRTDGNNTNVGTGPAANQAWQTITYAFANMTLTTGVNYLYIAPGVYRESPTLTVTPTATNTLVIAGDPTSSQFSGITSNQVRVTGAASDNTTMSAVTRIDLGTKSYVTLQNLYIEHNAASNSSRAIYTQGDFINITNNVIFSYYLGGGVGSGINIVAPNATGNNITVQNNIIFGCAYGILVNPPSSASGVTGILIRNNRISTNGWQNGWGIYVTAISGTNIASVTVTNCVITQMPQAGISFNHGNTTDKHIVQNCIIGLGSLAIQSTISNQVIQRNNILLTSTTLQNVASDATTIISDFLGLDYGQALLQGFGTLAPFATSLNSRNTGFGTATAAPATDLYGIPWTGATPDAGVATYRNLSSVGSYLPTERNASVLTIAPGATSQTVEVYLGATGLTSSTTGLSAYYIRNRSTSTAITLVARTPAQAWASGGFAEIDSVTVPGVYRLDLPDAAVAAGADDVTVVVRGASGTNGAVLTIRISSSGLSSAQTSAAVWDAARASHTTAGTFGEYVNAAVTNPSVQVRMGPFEVKADGLGASDPLDIQKGAQHGIDVQVVDGNGDGIDITGATVTAKVYNSGGALVDTYACTATYAVDGRATFDIDTTVTNTPGTYTATVTRSTGASDTQVCGPLRIYVRDI